MRVADIDSRQLSSFRSATKLYRHSTFINLAPTLSATSPLLNLSWTLLVFVKCNCLSDPYNITQISSVHDKYINCTTNTQYSTTNTQYSISPGLSTFMQPFK